MRAAILGLLFLVAPGALPAPTWTAQEAHRRADTVFYPELVARMNDWSISHGDPAASGHYQKFDSADKKRLDAARKAWKDFDQAWKDAGY